MAPSHAHQFAVILFAVCVYAWFASACGSSAVRGTGDATFEATPGTPAAVVAVRDEGVTLALPMGWSHSTSTLSGDISLFPNVRIGPAYRFVAVVFYPPLPYGFGTRDLGRVLDEIVASLTRQGGTVLAAEQRQIGGRDGLVVRSRQLMRDVELRQELYVIDPRGNVVSIGGDTSLTLVTMQEQIADFERVLQSISFTG